MKQERAKILAPFIKAFGDGEDIQSRYRDRESYTDSWMDGDDFNFADDYFEYRLKPKRLDCWVNVDDDNDYGFASREKAAHYCDAHQRTIHVVQADD